MKSVVGIVEAKTVSDVGEAEKTFDAALAQYRIAKEELAATRNAIRVALQADIEERLTEIYNKIIKGYFEPKEGLRKAYIYSRETKDDTKQLSLVVVFKSDAKNIGYADWKKDIENKYGIKVSISGGRTESVIQPTKEGLLALNLVSAKLKKKIANIK
jgi:hypothetical protein